MYKLKVKRYKQLFEAIMNRNKPETKQVAILYKINSSYKFKAKLSLWTKHKK